MVNTKLELRKIEFLIDLHKEIDSLELINPEKASELKQKYYDLASFDGSFSLDQPVRGSSLRDSHVLSISENSVTPETLDILPSLEIKKIDIHNPYQVSPFLQEFNGAEKLKFFTHKWDREDKFNHKKYLSEGWREFDALTKKYPDVPLSLVAKMKSFIFQKAFPEDKGWSFDKIKIGWSSPEIRDWCRLNPGKSPYPLNGSGLILKDPIKLADESIIRKFEKIVEKFKAEIEFREDNDNDIKRLIIDNFAIVNPIVEREFNIDTEKVVPGISLYTDIEKLMQAVRYIFRPINNLKELNAIEISFKDLIKEKYVELVILHKGSRFKKTLASFDEKIKNESGDTLGRAKRLLRSLCDWEIITSFSDGQFGCYKILPEEGMQSLPEEQFEGVKHILKFYRSE